MRKEAYCNEGERRIEAGRKWGREGYQEEKLKQGGKGEGKVIRKKN